MKDLLRKFSLLLFIFFTQTKGHFYPHYFAHQSYYHHNFAGSFGFGIPPQGNHHSSLATGFPAHTAHHVNWIGNPVSFGDTVPNVLKPSIVGWDTTYNVPCGSYTIYPFVVAHLRYQSINAFKKHVHPNPNWRQHRSVSTSEYNFHASLSKSCSWQFQAFGPCKLKFLCTWFQLPALFRCEENYIELTDSESFSYKFCGNRKPRGPYVSSERIKLTFKSESSALPTVFDCTVSCGLDALYECGKRSDPSSSGRIVGGSQTLPGEYPWVAALIRKSSNQPFCGGSLINDQYIVTAAHCVDRRKEELLLDPIEVLLNAYNISSSNRTQRIQISQISIHPKYNNFTYDHDIALLRLAEAIDIRDRTENLETEASSENPNSLEVLLKDSNAAKHVTPICLPVREKKSSQERHAIVTGWGLTKEGGIPSNTMMQAAVEIFNDTSCYQFYKNNNIITKQMLCAGHLQGKMDSCVGDSGGPLIVSKPTGAILVGIVSWGRGCARPNLPGVYTRLKGLTEWIQSNTHEDSSWCLE